MKDVPFNPNRYFDYLITYTALFAGVIGGIYLMNQAFQAGYYLGQHPEFLRASRIVRSKLKRIDDKIVGYEFAETIKQADKQVTEEPKPDAAD
jgi:hypothetical protein